MIHRPTLHVWRQGAIGFCDSAIGSVFPLEPISRCEYDPASFANTYRPVAHDGLTNCCCANSPTLCSLNVAGAVGDLVMLVWLLSYFGNVTLARICGTTERMSAVTLVEKKACLIPNAGEYRLTESRHLDRSFSGTGSDFGSVSRPSPETPAHTLWRTCVGR